MKCFKALQEICRDTARYLESHQIAGGIEVTMQNREQVLLLLTDLDKMILTAPSAINEPTIKLSLN